MWLYIGWGFIALSAIVAIFLIVKSKNQEEMNRNMGLIAVVAGSWVLGCVIVGHYHMYWYLYVTNTLAAGKFIVTMFTDRPWR